MAISSVLGSSALLPAGLGFRNLIINGDMRINQRNATVTSGSGYIVDRWQAQKFGNASISIAQSSDAPSVFTNSLKVTCTAGGAQTSGWLYQRVEGLNAACLGFGTASTKQVTVSFWVKSSLSGIYSVTLQNDQKTRVYAALYTISAADTWEYKTISIPGDTTGTWLKTTDSGLDVYFPFVNTNSPNSFYVASTFNAWSTGTGGMNFSVGTPDTPNVTATTGNTFAITGVQLEANIQPTPFEQRPYGVELQLCQRYFWSLTTSGQGQIMGAQVSAYGNACYLNISTLNPVPMRIPPTPGTHPSYSTASYPPYIADFNSNLRTVTAVNLSSPYMIQFVYNSTQLTANSSMGLNYADANRTLWLSAEL